MMRVALKVIVTGAIGYVLLVAGFESWLGYSQPTGANSLIITTTDGDGNANDRVLSALEVDGKLYVAANHWPRAWFDAALANPNVEARYKGEKKSYRAVPVSDAEHARVNGERPLGPIVRFLTGYPPRYFVRLDPAGGAAES